MKSWIMCCTLLATCLPAVAQDFRGKLIFSLEVVEWSLAMNADGSRGPKGKSGIFCYHEEARPASSGPNPFGLMVAATLSCYKLREGKTVGVAGPGSGESAGILQILRNSPLAAFDVKKEIDATDEKQRVSHGERIIVKDGSKVRLRYDFNGVSIDHTGWNPGSYISFYAQYSEDLKNLNDVVNVFALLIGRRELDL